jgi:hypothetical protein
LQVVGTKVKISCYSGGGLSCCGFSLVLVVTQGWLVVAGMRLTITISNQHSLIIITINVSTINTSPAHNHNQGCKKPMVFFKKHKKPVFFWLKPGFSGLDQFFFCFF